ncbi:hypothetical protein CAEBREN_21305 [Caenorhabditis brenneri]|uniref:Protein kinase domain-containing protein n=1 Tax=Caenorhabditis brenneri TaxID=135651 RepID=G0M8T0_CAEBE|nr:hypothetical protein CAEBREN_21305 [Caenorhabditis brenneri]
MIHFRHSFQFEHHASESKLRHARSASSDYEWNFFNFWFLLGCLIFFVAMFYYWKLTKPKDETVGRPVSGARYRPVENRRVPESSAQINILQRSAPAASAKNETPREDLIIRLLQLSISYEDFKRDVEIDTNLLKMGASLGDGQFGWVQLGTLKKGENDLKVAVKRSKKPYDRYEQEMFMAKLTVMCVIQKHPNILALVGGVKRTSPNKIVMEYVDGGNLLDFLRESRKNFKDSLVWETVEGNKQKTDHYMNNGARLSIGQSSINTFDLISYAYQIANGMLQLAKIPCVHRDLAARNILIASDGTIRIADFGLARKYGSKEYYTPGNEDPDKTPKPWLWMAPEAFENNKFTEKSDVWSFGEFQELADRLSLVHEKQKSLNNYV